MRTKLPLPARPLSSSPDTWEEEIASSAQRALSGQTPPELLAYSFAVDREQQVIHLKAHFSQPPSEDAVENIEIAETEIFSDFPDHFDAETEMEVVPAGQEPVPLSGGFVWRLGDPPWSPPASGSPPE